MPAVGLPPATDSLPGRFVRAREHFFRARYENLGVDVALTLGFAALTGFAAQLSFFTPFSPVPVTLQVFAALLSGVVLGYRWGVLSQVAYLAIGAFLIPWFAPAVGAAPFTAGGVSHLLGATGGYLITFPVAAFVVGYLSDRYVQARSPLPQIAIMLAGVSVIYAGGATGLWLSFHQTFSVVLAEGVLLFIPFDLAKGAVAGVIGSTLTPKAPFGPEGPTAASYRRWWPIGR